MGGYIDVNLYQVTGDFLKADINSNISLKIDPEGAKIALTAPFQNVTVVGNAANGFFLNRTDFDDLATVNNTFTAAFSANYFRVLPLWDHTALAVLLVLETVVANSTDFLINVDVSYFSPEYGNVRPYQQLFAPRGQSLRTVTYPFNIDIEGIKNIVKQALLNPGTCSDN